METESRIRGTATIGGTSTVFRRTGTTAGALAEAVVGWRRLWRGLRRGARATAGWIRETVTPIGWLLALAAALLLPLGLVVGLVELAVLGAVGLALLLLAVPFLFGADAYAIDLGISDSRVVAGTPVHGALGVRNAGRRLVLPGRIDVPIGEGLVEAEVPLLRAGQQHAHEVEVPTRRRGVVLVGPATSVRGDPIGILRREHAYAQQHELVVHPATVQIPSTSAGVIRDLEGEPTSTVVDSDLAFHAIREYRPGDSPRHIHWKSVAKTGGQTLMVRQFEETRRSRMAILLGLDPADYATEDEAELAISAAGSLAIRAIRDDRELAVLVGEPLPELELQLLYGARTVPAVSRRVLLDGLSRLETGVPVTPLEELAQLTADAFADLSIAFVFCGSEIAARRLQSIALKLPLGVAVVAVLCNEQAEPAYRVYGGVHVLTIALLEDFRQLLSRRRA